MTYEHNPIEMGLDRLIGWDLPDDASISIAALRRIRDEGVSRRIVGVELDGDAFPELNNVKWPALDDSGAEIGMVTSAIHSPRLGRNIGYCWLPVERAGDGTKVRVQTEWGSRTATVVPMPFVDPDKTIPVS
jgi:aminomethyltransferase